MIWGISLSFTNKTIGGGADFIGFKNYIKLLQDKEYLNSLLNTVKFTFFPLAENLFWNLDGIGAECEVPGKKYCESTLLIPWTLPNIVAVLNWRWIFSATGGIANYLLKSLHLIDKDLIWFGSAGLAMATIIVANVWRGDTVFWNFHFGKASDHTEGLL